MDTDLEIFNNLRKNHNFAIMRASSHRFLYMNPIALNMFGFSTLEEAHSYNRKMLFADSERYLHLGTKQKVYGTLTNERVLFSRKDHSSFWGSLTSRLYYVNGDVVYDEIIHDVSNEVLNEHRLSEKSNLLEKVATELDRFIYSASHDLRSPISTMKGLIYLFRVNQEAFSYAQLVDMMEECLNRLETFINKLVEFSKNANQPLTIEPINIGKVVARILDGLQRHPNKNKMYVELVGANDELVYSDYNKIYTALSHTITNSFDFLDPLKCSGMLSIKIDITKEKAIIEIVDNGVGIDKQFIPTVFQMFYRASGLSKGSGLGLYLAREAVVKLGGTIHISSEVNRATLVRIQVPNEIHQSLNANLGSKMA